MRTKDLVEFLAPFSGIDPLLFRVRDADPTRPAVGCNVLKMWTVVKRLGLPVLVFAVITARQLEAYKSDFKGIK